MIIHEPRRTGERADTARSGRPAHASRKRRIGLRLNWIPLVVLGLVSLAWIGVTTSGWVQDAFLPSPGSLWAGFVDLITNGYNCCSLLEHARMSLQRVLLGFVTGSITGTCLGLAMGYNRKIEAFFSPMIEFFRPLPQLAYLVLLVILFGIGEEARVILLFFTALPVASVAARDGVKSVSTQRVQAARSLGATELDVFRYVVFPSALHEIFTGARLAIGVVYATLIAAEMIAGTNGLGWMILNAGRYLRSDYVVVGIILLGVLGLLLDRLVASMETRVVHWAGRD